MSDIVQITTTDVSSEVKNKTVLEKLSEIAEGFKKVVSSWFNEEDYYIYYNQNHITVQFLFPVLTVESDSKNATHTIYDTIVSIRLKVANDKIYFGYISGQRGKMTYDELNSDYYFSHLSSQGGHFCYGSGTFSELISKFTLYDFDNFDKTLFVLFEKVVVGFFSYLKCESIEGGPYQRISSIGSNAQQRVFSSAEIQLFTRELTDYMKLNSKSLLILQNYDNMFIIDVGSIRKAISSLPAFSRFIVNINSKGEEIINSNTTNKTIPHFEFKEQTKRVELLSSVNTESIAEKKVPLHLIEQAIREISHKFTRYIYYES